MTGLGYPVEYSLLDNRGLPNFMRCIASPARGTRIGAGTYSPVVSVDGCAPNRAAVILDCFGAARRVCEREDGRWQLGIHDDARIVEFVSI
jgi:hypothetical protein